MRGKVIYRIACGTCAVCITYSLVSQALKGYDPVQAAAAEWAVTPAPVVSKTAATPVPDPNAITIPSAYYGGKNGYSNGTQGSGSASSGRNSGRGGKGGKGRGRGNAENDNTDYMQGYHESEGERIVTITVTGDNQEDGTSVQQENTSGDPPTLAQFLSAFRCGGCRHNCCLLNPRCMKGRSKMQNATVQYQQTYGG